MDATPTNAPWADWQEAYRHGAFYIFPPEDVRVVVDELRWRYDPKSARYCQAHVSLSEPLAAPLSKGQTREIETAMANVAPFEIHYGPLGNRENHPGVTFAINPEEAFFQLRHVLHGTSAFNGSEKKRAAIPPHMTVAEFIDAERSKEIVAELSGRISTGTFRCTEIAYAVPDDAFHFQRVLSVSLSSGEKVS